MASADHVIFNPEKLGVIIKHFIKGEKFRREFNDLSAVGAFSPTYQLQGEVEERVLCYTQGKNKPTVQFVKLKNKVVTSVTERHRMTIISPRKSSQPIA